MDNPSPAETLLSEFELSSALTLSNRLAMAPMTRSMAGEGLVPTPAMAEYYARRAAAGLLITEGAIVRADGQGYPDVPGIFTDAQVEGWTLVTRRVHEEGGRVFLQLWHVGRVSHPSYLDGELPIAPSAIPLEGRVPRSGGLEYGTPRAISADEIHELVEAFASGAANALAAGFDGVEIHGANGYLLDQFLQDSTNLRTDEYGGTEENRARLMLEVVDAVVGVWGPDRVGLHLAPRCDAHDMGDSDPAVTFGHVAYECGLRKIAFLFVRESLEEPRQGPMMKEVFGGAFIANQGLSREDGERLIEAGEANAIAWGQQFIANPDLPERFAAGADLNEPRPENYYGEGEEGYTDYPTMELPELVNG